MRKAIPMVELYKEDPKLENIIDELEPDWMGYSVDTIYEAVRDGLRVGLLYHLDLVQELQFENQKLRMELEKAKGEIGSKT